MGIFGSEQRESGGCVGAELHGIGRIECGEILEFVVRDIDGAAAEEADEIIFIGVL